MATASSGNKTGRKAPTRKAARRATPSRRKPASRKAAKNPRQRINLGPELDVTVARDLHARLCKLLDAGHSVDIDAASVEQADSAGLQLLAAFVRDARGRRTGIRWSRTSEPLRQVARRLGLSQMLGLSKKT